MKLLIVTPKVDKNDENLGAFYYWFEDLAKRFDEIIIIADGVGDQSLPANVSVYSLGKDEGRGRIRRLARFFHLFSSHYKKTDAVLFHMIPEFVLAASPFLLLRRRIRALWYAHGSVTRRLSFAERLVDYVFTSSARGFRLPSKKVLYMGQAIDTARFSPKAKPHASDAELRLVSVGRISPVKDYETIIRACKIVKDSFPGKWSFSIVGGPLLPRDHEYLSMLKKRADELGLKEEIRFLGARPYSEIPALLSGYDLFLNASKTGSLDKAVLEAMSLGLGIITANEAYRDILPPRYFLSHVRPSILAERILQLAAEPRPNESLRAIVVSDHSLARTMEKMSAVFHSRGGEVKLK